jgi:hypothetical protein
MIVQALRNLAPKAKWSLGGDTIVWISEDGVEHASNLQWFSSNIAIPTREEIETEVARLEAEYAANEYQRLRVSKYPPLADLADALYHQSKGDNTKMEAYVAACEAVKLKYPKGSE